MKIFKIIFLLFLSLYIFSEANFDDSVLILEKADEAESLDSSYSEIKQIITTSSGNKRTLELQGWSLDNNRLQLSLYTAPGDIKGQKILMTDNGDNIWMFNAETRRTRKLGSPMKKKKVNGSDFTYEDQAGGKLSEKYTSELIKTESKAGRDLYVLDLFPKPNGPSYTKVRAWVDSEDYISRQLDYYQNNESEPFKRMKIEDLRQIKDKFIPHKITMTNLEDKSSTVLIIDRIEIHVNIPESIFEASALGK